MSLPGRKPALLFLHGMFGKPDNWSRCIDCFAPDWNVHAPALPVFGIPAEKGVLEGLADCVCDAIAEKQLDEVVLVGNSIGGQVALHTALREPQRVAGLVLLGSSGLFQMSLERNIPRRPGRDWVRAKIREVFYDEAHVTEPLVDEISEVISDRRRVLQILRAAKAARRDDLRGVLHQIRCPVLLVWGDNDQVTELTVANEFKESLPEAVLRVIPRCGHAPMIERPEEFNRILADFLTRFSAETAVRTA